MIPPGQRVAPPLISGNSESYDPRDRLVRTPKLSQNYNF